MFKRFTVRFLDIIVQGILLRLVGTDWILFKSTLLFSLFFFFLRFCFLKALQSSSTDVKIDDVYDDGEFGSRKHFAKLISLFDDDGINLHFNHIILFRFLLKFRPRIKIDYKGPECFQSSRHWLLLFFRFSRLTAHLLTYLLEKE